MNRSNLKLYDGTLVHGTKYNNDRTYTLCGLSSFPILLVEGGRYCTYSRPVITCLRCIAESGTPT